VLSVGMKPSQGTKPIIDMLNLSVDQWGFINDHDLLSKKNIYVAGCASGPCDILTAKHQGMSCAQRVIQSFKSKQKPEQSVYSIAVIGDGEEAKKIASAALTKGYDTWMFGLNNKREIIESNINYVPSAKLISINGTAGSFKILYNDSGTVNQKKFAAIIVAESAKTSLLWREIDLPDDLLYSLGEFLNKIQKNIADVPQSLVFWLDYSSLEFKSFARKSLQIALDLAETGRDISIIMNQMLVHGLKGQQLYDRARKQGVKFLRINSSKDVCVTKMKDRILFDIKEKTLNNLTLSFECDWLVIPEKILPSDKNPFIAKLFKTQMDNEGYLQPANVRHRLINSLRKGMFFTGTCHDETDEKDQAFETELILSSIDAIVEESTHTSDMSIEINKNICRQCLTCFRICPHGAVVLNNDMKPYIDTNACFSCGLCISSCPALAIDSKALSDSSYINLISKDEAVIFACERSGAIAANQIELDSMINIQKVPCVCRISDNLLLKALANGAKKILLAGCHHDNCNSIKGSKKAQFQTERLNELPGIDNAAFIFHPFAANESAKFEEFLTLKFLPEVKNKG
jgi:coenzyme F420-reducing hydrogenase delta subunit/Pyruvate/2-oxoacid:ferredoxin oxidoreductase delta subunit